MSPRVQIDLESFAQNLRTIRERAAPAEHMLVVKDDAYGHGLEQIVRRAHREGVRWFGAFDVSTGVAVRRLLGDRVRIFSWMIGSPAELTDAADANLDIGVGDPDLLDEIIAAGFGARVHLKIDTGLHRNGIRPEEWEGALGVAANAQQRGRLRVEGVWTHIAEASDEDDDAARALFEQAIEHARRAGVHPRVRHLAASAAAFARAPFRYDLVRVGAFAYGIRSAHGPSDVELGLTPIATLIAEVTEIHPESVRVSIGALDGLPSTLAGLIDVTTPAGPRTLRQVGADNCIIDAWDGAELGDEVQVYGPAPARGVTDHAEAIGTIGEEIALRVSPLIPRTYR